MDFLQRNRNQQDSQPMADGVAPASRPQRGAPQSPERRKHIDWATRSVSIELFVVLLGCSLLLVAVSLFLGLNGTTRNAEADRVDTSKYQAVFLNGGSGTSKISFSTYFGHIRALNEKYIVLEDVYYLTPGEGGSSASSQLTKLGCQQIHAPFDQMVINRGQMAFWENIRDDGQVAKAINEFVKQNPDGPKCTSSTVKKNKTQPATNPQTP